MHPGGWTEPSGSRTTHPASAWCVKPPHRTETARKIEFPKSNGDESQSSGVERLESCCSLLCFDGAERALGVKGQILRCWRENAFHSWECWWDLCAQVFLEPSLVPHVLLISWFLLRLVNWLCTWPDVKEGLGESGCKAANLASVSGAGKALGPWPWLPRGCGYLASLISCLVRGSSV